jgi:hypothetical protein
MSKAHLAGAGSRDFDAGLIRTLTHIEGRKLEEFCAAMIWKQGAIE